MDKIRIECEALACPLYGYVFTTNHVDKAEEYKWSRAVDYFYGKPVGRIKMEWLDVMVMTV